MPMEDENQADNAFIVDVKDCFSLKESEKERLSVTELIRL